jgi:hypothetical protein
MIETIVRVMQLTMLSIVGLMLLWVVINMVIAVYLMRRG